MKTITYWLLVRFGRQKTAVILSGLFLALAISYVGLWITNEDLAISILVIFAAVTVLTFVVIATYHIILGALPERKKPDEAVIYESDVPPPRMNAGEYMDSVAEALNIEKPPHIWKDDEERRRYFALNHFYRTGNILDDDYWTGLD